jgi:hypothetical protein
MRHPLPALRCAAAAAALLFSCVFASTAAQQTPQPAAASGSPSWQLLQPRSGAPLNVSGAPFFDALTAATAPVPGYDGTREPVIPHAAQDAAAAAKLAALGVKPNILIFLMDDVGWGDLGAFGGGGAVGSPTPNFDRAAAQGLLLSSAYAQPSCSPTRGSLLTGRLPMRHGVLRPPMAGELGGLSGEVTLPQLLRGGAGYATAAVGKWHCGENNASQPQNVGFDQFLGFLCARAARARPAMRFRSSSSILRAGAAAPPCRIVALTQQRARAHARSRAGPCLTCTRSGATRSTTRTL